MGFFFFWLGKSTCHFFLYREKRRVFFPFCGSCLHRCKRLVVFALQSKKWQVVLVFSFTFIFFFFTQTRPGLRGLNCLKMPFSIAISDDLDMDLLQIQFPMVLSHWFSLKLSQTIAKNWVPLYSFWTPKMIQKGPNQFIKFFKNFQPVLWIIHKLDKTPKLSQKFILKKWVFQTPYTTKRNNFLFIFF